MSSSYLETVHKNRYKKCGIHTNIEQQFLKNVCFMRNYKLQDLCVLELGIIISNIDYRIMLS